MSKKYLKLISGQFANDRIEVALKDLEKHWEKAGFLSTGFKEEKKIFKQIIYDEMSEEYLVCDHDC